jgi:hypothetical protein
VAGGNGEIGSRAINGIGVAIALRAGYGRGAGRDEFLERSAMSILGNEAALGLGDLQEIHAHTGQADGLGWCSAFVGDGHFLDRVEIDAGGDRGNHKQTGEGTHEPIVEWRPGQNKSGERRACARKQSPADADGFQKRGVSGIPTSLFLEAKNDIEKVRRASGNAVFRMVAEELGAGKEAGP